MKNIYYLGYLIGIILFATSCEKHEVEYDTTNLGNDIAEFQIHYCAPIVSTTAAYIYQVNVNDSLYANTNSPLLPYNAIPNGSVGRFFTVKAGTVNLKMYTGKTTPTLAYNQNCTLKAGKQNIFVYDLQQPPIVFDNGYPYITNTTANTDSTAWVKFYNFMYENSTTPTTLKLQYQYYYKDPKTSLYSDTVNVGKPVSFGETTDWQPVKVKKTVFNSSGYITLYYLIKVIDANGNDLGFLQMVNSKGKTVSYSDYWNAYIGRRYHHVLAGIRTQKSPSIAVSVFTAL